MDEGPRRGCQEPRGANNISLEMPKEDFLFPAIQSIPECPRPEGVPFEPTTPSPSETARQSSICYFEHHKRRRSSSDKDEYNVAAAAAPTVLPCEEAYPRIHHKCSTLFASSTTLSFSRATEGGETQKASMTINISRLLNDIKR